MVIWCVLVVRCAAADLLTLIHRRICQHSNIVILPNVR